MPLLSRRAKSRRPEHRWAPRQNRDAGLVRSTAVELAVLGNALEGLTGTLDPVLIVVALRRQRLYDGVTAGRRCAAKRRRGVIDSFTHLVLVRAHRNFMHGHRLNWWTLRADHLCRCARRPRRPCGLANGQAS